jgi:hypothetical protein
LPLGWTLGALEASFVKAVIAARVAGSGWKVLAYVSIHVDLEHPISDLVTFSSTHQVFLWETDVVWRRYISFFKIGVVVYAIIVRVLDGIVEVDISVEKDEREVILFHLFVGLSGFKEGLVGADFLAVSEETCAKFGGNPIKLVALALGLEKEQVGDHQVLHKLLEDTVVLIANHLFQVLDQLLEHLFQHYKFNFIH